MLTTVTAGEMHPFRDRFVTVSGPFWDRFVAVWGRFGAVSRSFRCRSGGGGGVTSAESAGRT